MPHFGLPPNSAFFPGNSAFFLQGFLFALQAFVSFRSFTLGSSGLGARFRDRKFDFRHFWLQNFVSG